MRSRRRSVAVSAALGAAVVATLTAPVGAVVPGTNGKIAFERDLEIWSMNADGSVQVRLTNNPAFDEFPAWSPDGTKIAFETNRDGNDEVYVMNADGSGPVNRTNNAAADGRPVWSPDGTKIAFSSDRDGNLEIYVMNADGTNPTRSTTDPGLDGFPAWSPDGTRIAFHTDRDGDVEVYVMNANGSGQTRLTNSPSLDGSPEWSPDGSRIVFHTARDGNIEVYSMNADGSGQTNLTNAAGYEAYPDWSPDGTRIAFETNRDGFPEIYSMNANGSGQANLTNDPASDEAPSWQAAPGGPAPGTGPTISSFDPSSGPVGTRVTIAGTNLSPLTSVTIGAAAAGVTANSASQIVATVPQGATSGPIVVTTPNGSATSAGSFSVTGAGVAGEHERSLSLTLGRKARGLVTVADGSASCGVHVPVTVQRRERGRWALVGTDTTSARGRFVVPGTSEPGRYRALAKRMTLDAGDVCLKAVSARAEH